MAFQDADNYSYEGLGYRRDIENLPELLAGAQKNDFLMGDIDPKSLGAPMGISKWMRIENQLRMNSCAGNSAASIVEACLYHQSGGTLIVQLSRMFAYINGQAKCGIRGDRGATLKGVIDGLREFGIPLEELAQYTGAYYTQFSSAAQTEARTRKLVSYSQITDVDQVYEGLAKKIGGVYLGCGWCGEFRNCPQSGFVNSFYEESGCGFHATCILDWSDEKDSEGYPRLENFNSHSEQYGFKGRARWSRSALQQAIKAPNTVCFLLSEMQFIKPRFDFKKQSWTDVD